MPAQVAGEGAARGVADGAQAEVADGAGPTRGEKTLGDRVDQCETGRETVQRQNWIVWEATEGRFAAGSEDVDVRE